MKDEIIHISSLTQLHEGLNYNEKPLHPLISVVDVSKLEITEEMLDVKISMDYYYIALKDQDCGLQYGRSHYDFSEGVLAFSAPNQVLSARTTTEAGKDNGWMIYFNPDLIRNSNLGQNIDDYTFFSYDLDEALHLSEKERQTLTKVVENIKNECKERIDNHTQKVLVSNLELLLNYCSRFYDRQFTTRHNKNKDLLSEFEAILKTYFKSETLPELGPPSLQYLAEQLNLSPNYLSDLLKKETGKSAKDHINRYIIELAKTMLLNNSGSVSEIAYNLGFNYPHYFSRLFKSKTGMTPQEFRKLD